MGKVKIHKNKYYLLRWLSKRGSLVDDFPYYKRGLNVNETYLLNYSSNWL